MAQKSTQMQTSKTSGKKPGAGSEFLRQTAIFFCLGAIVLLGLWGVGELSPRALGGSLLGLAGLSVVAGFLVRGVFSSGAGGASLGPSDALGLKNFRTNLVNALQEPALFVSPDGRVDCANAAARKNFRFMGEAPFLSSIIRRPELLEAVSTATESRTQQTFSIVLLDDLDRHYACRATPIDMESGVGVLVTMHDLTEVKRAERARADFLANASHELRTPLTSLAGFIETMRGPAKDDHEAWDRFLEIMYGQAERMRRLINDLLSLSRIELNEHRRPETDADFAAVVSEAVDALEPLATEKGVTLNFEGLKTGVLVHGVRDELAQVAQNLIDNAVKYSEDGQTVTITVGSNLSRDEAVSLAGRGMVGASRMTISSSPSGTAQGYAVLRIEDEGPGIDRKFLPRLAERFYRVDPGRGLRRGTGLGLAIVKHIISRHRGDFLVESLVDAGTAFGVLLPMAPATQDIAQGVSPALTDIVEEVEIHD